MGLLYNATKWLDHVTQFPMRKRITQNSDGTSDVVRAEGEIIQQGTPRNASNYNNIETGILANQIHILVLQQKKVCYNEFTVNVFTLNERVVKKEI